MNYVVLSFTGATPDVDVSDAPNYAVGAKNADGTLGMVGGDFTDANIEALDAAGKVCLDQSEARAQVVSWIPSGFKDGTSI